MSEPPDVTRGDLPAFETWDDHVNEWITVSKSLEDHLWYLGSIAASITRKYGDKAIPEFAVAVNYSPRRIWELAATYKAWEYRDRAHDLSFKHHTIAARSEDPDGVIEQALSAERPMSTRELERVVHEEGEPPDVVRVEAVTCPRCGGRGEVPVE